MHIIRKAIYLVISLFIVGCLHNESKSELVTELEGEWISSCTLFANGRSLINITDISNNSILEEYNIFNDTNCVSKLATVNAIGSFTIGNEKIITSGETVKEINYRITEWSMTTYEDSFIEELNNDNRCEKNNWSKNTKVIVSGCDDNQYPPMVYDIYKIDDEKFFPGDSDFGDTLTSSTRPTQLSPNFYIKVKL